MPTIHALRGTLILFALLPAAGCNAETYSLAVRVSNGKAAYARTFKLSEGRQFGYTGPAKALNGGAGMQMIFNGILAPGRDKTGMLRLQYQVELAGGRGSQGRSIQGQSEVAIRPGDRLTAIACGPWTVEIGLAGKKAAGENPDETVPSRTALQNYRLTADISAGNSRQQCGFIALAGVQSSVSDSIMEAGRKYGLIFAGLFAPSGGDRGFSLQYQTDYGVKEPAQSFQMQDTKPLALDKKTAVTGEDCGIELLLENAAPAKRAAPREPAE